MFSNDEHSGLFVFIIGLVIVVFAGIALSIAVDRRFIFSSSVSALEADIRRNEPELEHLRASHREGSWRLFELEPKRKTAVAALTSLEKSVADLERRMATLVTERKRLGESIPVMEDGFARYRAKYRSMVRDAAIGESLGTLTTLGGREYNEAFITRVSDVGLEIRHAHGIARISATDLEPAWRNRFHWDDEESMARLAGKVAARQMETRPPEAADVVERPAPNPGATRRDLRKIDMLRGKVIAWKNKIAQLRQERNHALFSADGSQASVPGDLETWQVRSKRLSAELEMAEAELAAAKASLALASPGDALLR